MRETGERGEETSVPTFFIFSLCLLLLHTTHYYLNLEQTWEMSIPVPLGRNTRPKWATYRSYFFFPVTVKNKVGVRDVLPPKPPRWDSLVLNIFVSFFISNTILSRGEEAFLHRLGDELLLNSGAKYQRWFIVSRVKIQNDHGNFQ